MIKTNLHSNYVNEIIGEYYAAKGYSVQSMDRRENGQLIIVVQREIEEMEPEKVDIAFDFIHKRPIERGT
ncbi:hypothetical protein NST16_08595 [Bacillus sp. FSL K6-1005]|uniref:hypothetical protein n=1 Tax=Bacillus sp. FSL K6-1005 TaxID=2954676 RepID=UPI0030FAC8D9